MRNFLLAVLLALPGVLCAQIVPVSPSQCVYRLGDNPAWAATEISPGGWRSYADYRMTSDTYLFWIRCRISMDTSGMRQPVIGINNGTVALKSYEVFIDGEPAYRFILSNSIYFTYAVPSRPERSVHILALRVHQHSLVPGLTPGLPVTFMYGDATYLQKQAEVDIGNALSSLVPPFTVYIVIGAAGLFLLGFFLFDRSQKAAFWLGLYCCCVGLTRLNYMLYLILLGYYPSWVNNLFFGLAMLESWALVRVNFALVQKRTPVIYWVVFAAWVFMLCGSVLPVLLPAHLALPLSLFVQSTSFKPIWCIWAFACTAPFVAFWPWAQLRSRFRVVAPLCAIWAVIEGWFQLQQVLFGRNLWSNHVQAFMSMAIAAVVISLLGYLLHKQRIAAEERAELRGELAAAGQVQHLLIPDKLLVAQGVTVNSAFLPARDVGGDFYLCRVLPNGAQRVLLGDVSGKGAAAALTSALLVGAADRCDHLAPVAVLDELNSALRNHSITGFTTCVCADLLPNGLLTIANAGHLPPYRNGDEMEFPPSIPLGIDPAASYSESTIQLAPGDTLTFMSDGVVEARNAAGDLLGFERTRAISSRSAQQIANEAVAFGQEDDITVLTLSLTPDPSAA